MSVEKDTVCCGIIFSCVVLVWCWKWPFGPLPAPCAQWTCGSRSDAVASLPAWCELNVRPKPEQELGEWSQAALNK